MISFIGAILAFFPVSFLAYAISQRFIAKHESRVGAKILWTEFLWQTWLDAWISLKALKPRHLWIVYALQFSILFFLNTDIDYLIFVYLAVTAYGLVIPATFEVRATHQIRADRLQVRHAVATGIAALCIFACFTFSSSVSLAQIHWSLLDLLFVIPFQLAGLILFDEQPFQGMEKRNGWLESARFYVWSVLAAQLFLGGGDYFLDLHLKSLALYLIFRIFGIYFPRFQQKDLLRISILYLFPITGLLWLLAMLVHGMVQAGVSNV